MNRVAGKSLAEAGGLPPARNAAPEPKVSANILPPPTVKPAQQPPDLMKIIQPNARNRWMTGLINIYTPQFIESTIRGAMAGNLTAIWTMFDLMERTWPRLAKNLNELKNAVINLDWNLQPFAIKGSRPSPEAQRRKRIIDQMLWSMRPELKRDENDFNDVLRDIMDAVGKGISLQEIYYERKPVNVSGDPGKVAMQELLCPRATKLVPVAFYGYPGTINAEDELMLNVREIRQTNPNFNVAPVADGIWAPIPPNQFICSIFKAKSGHPLGGAMLSILGYWWAASNFTWDWFLNFAQIFGMPIRWATFAPNVPESTITSLLAMLEQMGTLAYAAFPEGTNLELKEGATDARNVPHKVLIDAADTICDVVILGQTSSTQVREGGGVGSGHAAALQGDVRKERISAVAGGAAKVVNLEFLPALCRLNFGDDTECPKAVPTDKSGKDALAVATRYKMILSIPGVEVSKQQFYSENDLIIPDEDDEVLVATAAPQQQQEDPNSGSSNDDPPSSLAQGRGARCGCHRAQARSGGDDQILNRALEDLTGVEEKWLGGVKPFFHGLIALAQAKNVTDEDFIAALKKAQAHIPELFKHIDHQALATALENAMAASAVNGATRGYLDRHAGQTSIARGQEVVV